MFQTFCRIITVAVLMGSIYGAIGMTLGGRDMVRFQQLLVRGEK